MLNFVALLIHIPGACDCCDDDDDDEEEEEVEEGEEEQDDICVACKGGCQKLLSGFFPLRGYPPLPYPLNGKSFCQKTLSGKGGYTPSPLN